MNTISAGIGIVPLITIAVFAVVAVTVAVVVVMMIASRSRRRAAAILLAAGLFLVGSIGVVCLAALDEPDGSLVLDYRGDDAPIPDSVLITGDATVIDAEAWDDSGTEIAVCTPSGSMNEPLSTRPAWVEDERSFDPWADSPTFAISSDPWATVEEAETELWGQLAEHAGSYFSVTHPQAAGWTPDPAVLQELDLVRDGVRETIPLEVGEHTVRVHQVHWLVEFPPELRERLFDAWRPVVVEQRLIRVGGALGVLTVLFALLTGLLRWRGRRDRSTQPEWARDDAVMV